MRTPIGILIKTHFALLLLAVSMVACSASAAPTPTPVDGIQAIEPPLALADFTLTDQHNQPIRLSDLKGKAVLLTFGYTHCPDVCPVNLANFKRIKQMLGTDAARVAFAFVSVDGKRDTPPVLARYIDLFDPSFIGMMGDDSATHQAAKQFGAAYFIDSDAVDYTVTHTAATFLVDPQNQWRRVYSFNLPPAQIAADIEQMLKS